MYKNIVFDMGGVLLDFSHAGLMSRYFGHFSPQEQLRIRHAIFSTGLWNRMDRGDFHEDEMVRQVNALLPPQFHSAAENMILHYFDAMPPLPVNELIPQLKARGQRVYLLSNAPHAFHREKHRLPYLPLFDGVLASCDVGLLKPNKEIYLRFLQTFSLKAEDCFFIDDMQANIDGAAAAGIAGYCYEKQDLLALKRALGLPLQYIIDRIVQGIAVCEREDGTLEEIPARLLPDGTREGSVLLHENGTWSLDAETESKRRKALFEKQEGLFG